MNKEYVQERITVLFSLIQNELLEEKDGKRIALSYWGIIKEELTSHKIATSLAGAIQLSNKNKALSLIEKSKTELETIQNRDYDRQLDNASKKSSMRYARRSYIISIISIIIASISIVLQLILLI